MRATPAGHSQARGRAPFGRAFGPHRGDRSPRWIYPNLIDPNTRCREPVPRAWWKLRAGRPCGNLGSFERIRLAHCASSATHRKGSRLYALAKEAHTRRHPGCLPPLSSLELNKNSPVKPTLARL